MKCSGKYLLGLGQWTRLIIYPSCYIEGIRRVQPHGPYALLGLSFGGNLVFELTKRLEKGGETVAFAGGIDNPVDLRILIDKRRQAQGNFLLTSFISTPYLPTTPRWTLKHR